MSISHPIYLDRPIQKKEDDRLRRAGFAQSIAEQIQYSPRDESYVTALVGPWGSGKTSVLNMIEEILSHGDATHLFLRFNPWLFSKHEHLLAHFFQEIAAELRERREPELTGIWRGFEAYSRYLRPLRAVVEERGDRMGESDTEETSLNQRRRALEKALRNSTYRLVVVIDDIDRLEDGEIRDVMRLVRLVGDFPNMVYVLAYDRERVEEVLGAGGRGKIYLDKIVQIEHRIPKLMQSDLSNLWLERVNTVLEGIPLFVVDKGHLTTLVHQYLVPFFQGPREINRYVNALRPTVRRVGQEVALFDLMALEAIRVLVPKVFEGIIKHTGDFCPPANTYLHGRYDRNDDEPRKKNLEGIFEAAGTYRDLVVPLLKHLFPRIQRLSGGLDYSDDDRSRRRKECLVADRDVLEIYLNKALPDGVLPSPDVREALENLGNESALNEKLDGMDPELLHNLFIRLCDYEQDFRPETVGSALRVFMNHWPRLKERAKNASFKDAMMGSDWSIYRVIASMIKLVKEDDRGALVVSLLERLPRYSLKSELISTISGAKLVNEATGIELKQGLCEQMLGASDEELAEESSLSGLLFKHLMKFDQTRAELRMRKLIAHERGFCRILTSGLAHSSNRVPELEPSERNQYELLWWDEMEQVLGAKKLEECIRDFDARREELSLSQKEAIALDLALDYLKGWRPPARFMRPVSPPEDTSPDSNTTNAPPDDKTQHEQTTEP